MEFHSSKLWQTIDSLAGSRRKSAAIAYFTSDAVLHFGSGDVLAVDASDYAIKAGQTSVDALRRAFDRGAELFSVERLHAKVIVLDDTAIIGSANLSNYSRDLIEAGVITKDERVLADCRDFIRGVAATGTRIDSSFLERIGKLPVKRNWPKPKPKRSDITIYDGLETELPPLTGVTRCVNFHDGSTGTNESVRRVWSDARRLQFVSAGGKAIHRQRIECIEPGDRLLAYVSYKGVVGVGVAVRSAEPIHDFAPIMSETKGGLLRQPLESTNLNHNSDDPDLCEYCVPVLWQAWAPIENAYWVPRLGNPNVVWTPGKHLSKWVTETLSHYGIEQ